MPLDQLTDEEIDAEGKEMSFLDHLEELRWHIIRAVGSIFVFALIAFIFIEDIFRVVIMGPKNPDFWTYRMMCKLSDMTGYADLCVKKLNFELQALGVSDQFTMALTSSLIIGLCFAFPYAFWELWRFIKPGLRSSEKNAARGAVFYVSMLFLLGLMFGYFIVSPLAINFLANYQITPEIKNQFDITSYIGILVTLSLGCALMFQMPIVAFVLSKVGVLTPSFMKEYRKHAWIVILVVAGIITPSPDIYSQVLVALPLAALYEVSIIVSGSVERARLKELRELTK
ncbi:MULTISPECIES: twin-arginine translocase subunit TatC [Spirosoma]|uniref:Sec-independent protein translocase protein TatC n=1 Tax=Spirosoma liriopis TaxID=2937440 RepID=A0ABT0HJE0_9BACT|nr:MULTISPECIES: twin-arginine translocase subunit TatC [Spirosoma]MCK8492269.1 twin-arginine translocase subunit TatC [Spirosoma liriopis]UHG91683.1 twin-arginine translocase subunit TatC [Spirosoma oryzicola]